MSGRSVWIVGSLALCPRALAKRSNPHPRPRQTLLCRFPIDLTHTDIDFNIPIHECICVMQRAHTSTGSTTPLY